MPGDTAATALALYDEVDLRSSRRYSPPGARRKRRRQGLDVIESVGRILHDLPALCLFLSILLGTIIGRFHVKGVGFGSVVGTLIAGIIIGILAKPELPDMLRWSFFYLFLFSIGYSVGPQFFGSLKREALPQIALAVVVATSGLAAVVAVTAIFGFDEGLAVGVLSGAMTQSAALGTGVSAIAELPPPRTSGPS